MKDFAWWTSPEGRKRAAEIVALAKAKGFFRAQMVAFPMHAKPTLCLEEDMKYMPDAEHRRRVEPLFNDAEYDLCKSAGGGGMVRIA